MIIIFKKNYLVKDYKLLISLLKEAGLVYKEFNHNEGLVFLIDGKTHLIDSNRINAIGSIREIKRIQPEYKKVATVEKKELPFTIIAGPCAIESREETIKLAQSLKKRGAKIFRGGAFKPRTSPYSFQGLQKEGIAILKEVKELVQIPVITEIVDTRHIELFEDIDIIQIGARNMQNFELLKEVGLSKKTILIKRNPGCDIKEVLLSAEYVASQGNDKIILCERGIKTFEIATRNTLDLSAVAILKKETNLPIIVDPSHGTGLSELIENMSLASIGAGCDGLMIEVHQNPAISVSDGRQSITPSEFEKIAIKSNNLKDFLKEGNKWTQ